MKRWMNMPVLLLVIAALLALGLPFTQAQDNADTVELIGPIEAMTDTGITVNGQEIAIEPDDISEILGLGTSVIVKARLEGDGTLSAEGVRALDGRFLLPGELLVSGTLDESTASKLTVNGIAIDASNLEQADLETGAPVWLIVMAGVDDALTARNALALDAGQTAALAIQTAGDEADSATAGGLVFFGTLQAVDEADNTITVSGRAFATDDADMPDDLLPGTLVAVRVAADNTGQATRIAYADLFDSAVTVLDADATPTAEAPAPPAEGEAAG